MKGPVLCAGTLYNQELEVESIREDFHGSQKEKSR
jgi:hypothetical protein